MKDRIKSIRKTAGMTQTDFGNAIGVKGNTVTNYESGLRVPSDAIILSICREFNVNETWLRTGEGEMFIEQTRDEQIASFMGELMRGEDDSFKHRFIAMLSKMSEDEWDLMAKKAKELGELLK